MQTSDTITARHTLVILPMNNTSLSRFEEIRRVTTEPIEYNTALDTSRYPSVSE